MANKEKNIGRKNLEIIYQDLDNKKLMKLLIDKILENLELEKQLSIHTVMQAQPENEKCEIPNWDKSGRCFKCGKLVENHD